MTIPKVGVIADAALLTARQLARWPEICVLNPGQASTVLDGARLANQAELKRRVHPIALAILRDLMGSPRWSPIDFAPITLAVVEGKLWVENGEHRLRAVIDRGRGVPMLIQLKEHRSMADFRASLSQHDTAQVPRTVIQRANAAGQPVPPLGSVVYYSGNGTGNPALFIAAWMVLSQFGARPFLVPKTLQMWQEQVYPMLRAPVDALSKASRRSSRLPSRMRISVERILYRGLSLAILIEIFRVDAPKAAEFIARLFDQREQPVTDFVHEIAKWVYREKGKLSHQRDRDVWTYQLPRKMLNAWYAHANDHTAPVAAIREVKRAYIEGSKLICWPVSTDRPPKPDFLKK